MMTVLIWPLTCALLQQSCADLQSMPGHMYGATCYESACSFVAGIEVHGESCSILPIARLTPAYT